MENDVLSLVVAAEKEIQKNLEIERKKSREWVEQVKREAEEKVAAEEIRHKEALIRAVRDAKEEAGKKAAGILDEAVARAEMMKGLDHGFLAGVTMRHIMRILPGEDRDSPHGKG
ncbi:MAG TPA: hypothetical protein VEI96_08380 [Thermodesulfovibrionales bacterium]|nr:hypothetical protein [Thermodesulfovibrionales bacterium]